MTDNISEKDKKDWENFLSKNEKLPNKDVIKGKKIIFKTRLIDLHGYSLEEANKSIEDFIIKSYQEKIKKIYDTWVFSRDITSANPNWKLVNTLT